MLYIAHLFFRYHAGSLAFGSLILAIVQVIRVILEYLDQKLKGLAISLFSFFFSRCAFRPLQLLNIGLLTLMLITTSMIFFHGALRWCFEGWRIKAHSDRCFHAQKSIIKQNVLWFIVVRRKQELMRLGIVFYFWCLQATSQFMVLLFKKRATWKITFCVSLESQLNRFGNENE